MLHFTETSLKKNDETLTGTKQLYTAFPCFESEPNRVRLKIIEFVVENEKREFLYNHFTNSYIHSSPSIRSSCRLLL